MKKISLILAMILFCFSLSLFAGDWQPAANTNVDRHEHKGIILDNGNFMIVSGYSSGEITPTCEIYDFQTGQWSFTDSLHIGRYGFNLTKLQNGKIMVISGMSPNGYTSSCEIYDPNTGEWSFTDSLTYARTHFASIVLENGNVLTTAGTDRQGRKTCEIYDPNLETWQLTSSLNEGRHSHTLTLLPDGRVLAAGDENSQICEIFDPNTETWEITDSLIVGRREEGETVTLKNGLILFISGLGDPNNPVLESCELFDPETETWSLAGSLQTGRTCFGFTLLPNGNVLVNGGMTDGGASLKSCEIYNPDTNTWTQEPDMIDFRGNHANGLLPDGRVITAAGNGVTRTEIYTWNYAPEIEINGPSTATILDSLEFEIEIQDPNQDSISFQYLFSSDSDIPYWSNFQEPGTFPISHVFESPGTYTLSVQAKDIWSQENIHNSMSNWEVHEIEISDLSASSPESSQLELHLENYPNPFKESTTISYYLPKPTNVKISIYNTRGRLVKTLISSKKQLGKHQMVYQSDLSSGIYIFKLETNTKVIAKKMLLTK